MVKSVISTISRAAIILFCLWHMSAVAILALPWQATDRASHWVFDHVGPIFSPYIYWLSQWQQWNLFSPNPLRRVTTYVIEAKQQNVWHVVSAIDGHTYPRSRNSTHVKMFSEMLQSDEGMMHDEIVQHFLASFCAPHNLPAGTPIRLTYQWYVIPVPEVANLGQWAKTWKPIPQTSPGMNITCPSS